MSLCAPYFETNRVVTADNFFSSVPLINKLYEKKLRYVGTLKKNKKEIPKSFLPNKSKELYSTMFGYNDRMTLASYVPKINKSVLLISSLHNDGSIDQTDNEKKPHMILYYNKTKGGVDTFDKLIEHNTVRRKVNKWPLNMFMYMIDVAVHNAFILFQIKNFNA